jgi:predicted RNA-binding Zn ribbon-like protein
MPQMEKFKELKILGERPSIDFINTVDWRGRENQENYIKNYDDLVDWAILAKQITQKEADELKEKAQKDPKKAAEVYDQAMRFREAAYRALVSISFDEEPSKEDEETLNSEMHKTFSHLTLNLREKRLELGDQLGLEYILGLMVKDAVDLMTSDELDKVKRCSSEECGWLFIDTSRNSSRKWCRMGSCGNRAKARRHYNRSK